jgi:hypothetical protein
MGGGGGEGVIKPLWKSEPVLATVILSIWLYGLALVMPSSLDLFGTFGYHR